MSVSFARGRVSFPSGSAPSSRSLRRVYIAVLVSMTGSGMALAATTWSLFQSTRSEIQLGLLVAIQTVPALVMLPLGSLIIDRWERRRLAMCLDLARGTVTLIAAWLAIEGDLRAGHLYLLTLCVSAAFWLFWPTVTALVQELADERSFASANAHLLSAIQGGGLAAGALVGVLYDRGGLGTILLLDVATYAISFLCFWSLAGHALGASGVGNGESLHGGHARISAIGDVLVFLGSRRSVMLLGWSWALLTGAVLSQGVILAPLSERVLDTGVVGLGWLNAGWAIGALISGLCARLALERVGHRRLLLLALAFLSVGAALLPWSGTLVTAVVLLALMGMARGVGGVAISSELMSQVPTCLMGRVQTVMHFVAAAVQIASGMWLGVVGERFTLWAAFAALGSLYLISCLAAGHSKRVSRSVVAVGCTGRAV